MLSAYKLLLVEKSALVPVPILKLYTSPVCLSHCKLQLVIINILKTNGGGGGRVSLGKNLHFFTGSTSDTERRGRGAEI